MPGHSIETFPEEMREVAAAGHEIGAHGYSHENPVAMNPRQEEDVLVRSVELVQKLAGKPPRGFVAPWWEMSAVTAELLLKYGFRYDRSQGHHGICARATARDYQSRSYLHNRSAEAHRPK